MAEVIGKAAASVAGVHVDVLPTGKVATRDLLTYDAILLGSVVLHGQLTGKVGGAFASGGNIAGGNETTILSLLCALMIHGMIVQGTNSGDHYGPVAIGDLDERSRQQCHAYGERLARLADKLHG
jgi:NAD(P)H dehydrogenase (quinone)